MVGPFKSLVANGASVEAYVQVVVIVALELFCSAERTDWNLKNIAENAFVSQIILFTFWKTFYKRLESLPEVSLLP